MEWLGAAGVVRSMRYENHWLYRTVDAIVGVIDLLELACFVISLPVRLAALLLA